MDSKRAGLKNRAAMKIPANPVNIKNLFLVTFFKQKQWRF